jgi:aminoglycoside 2'-N-acetyltransferase I
VRTVRRFVRKDGPAKPRSPGGVTPDRPSPSFDQPVGYRGRVEAERDGPVRLRRLATDELTPGEVAQIRSVLDAAFWDDEEERFTDDDWDHAVGGLHVVLDIAGEIVAHGSVVERALEIDHRPVRTGYVEAVATAPGRQARGYGTRVMREIGDEIRARFELGALGTGSQGFYERLGWETWVGPSSVRTPEGEHRTPDEDGYIMILRTPSTPPLERGAPISCEWRPGDVW